ncbi:hypothetical protein RSAG8_00607, partial [Rhizoctonia solani AG-8 WAC10335]
MLSTARGSSMSGDEILSEGWDRDLLIISSLAPSEDVLAGDVEKFIPHELNMVAGTRSSSTHSVRTLYTSAQLGPTLAINTIIPVVILILVLNHWWINFFFSALCYNHQPRALSDPCPGEAHTDRDAERDHIWDFPWIVWVKLTSIYNHDLFPGKLRPR